MKAVSLFFFFICLSCVNAQIKELRESQETRKKYIDPSATDKRMPRRRMDFIQHVDPLIGTGAHGHTYPGAVAPFGMMQLSPDTRYKGWDGCSGYHYSDSVIYGFSHTHLSGTGVEDLCDLLIVPQQGKYSTTPGYLSKKGYGSLFRHSDEKARPGYYTVKLLKNNIDVRLTAGERSGLHEYTFHEKKGKKYILIDLDHRDQLLAADLNVEGNTIVTGHRLSSSWARRQHFYFHLETNTPFTSYHFSGKNKLVLEFPEKMEKILIKVGISAVDVEGAKKNVLGEIPYFDFEMLKTTTESDWNEELNKIHFQSPDPEVMKNFYTAVYHSYLCPTLFSDVDGRFRGNDEQIHSDTDTRYSVFSIWDTYRAAHPLYTLTQQKRSAGFINSFLGIYKETGELPVWELLGNETDCMIGYHACSIILDAYRKGIRDFDAILALEAMQKTATKNELGKNFFIDNEFIGSEQSPESVSKTLEYAYDDWAISEFAKELGQQDVSLEYAKKSYQFLNLYRPDSKFMAPRRGGSWIAGFNPSEVNFNFTEANSWQYSMAAPQHLDALRKVIGGKDSLEHWLDKLFTAKSTLEGRQQADITGLIGQYAHGNEPSHHMAYLYNYTNHPDKAQKMADQILKEMYRPTPEGLSGNEDCGQMSAWYVLSAVGIYPVCPGKTSYAFGRPLQETASFNFENGNSFTIRTENNAPDNKYIQQIILNDREYKKLYIEQDSLLKGGELMFIMGDKPNPELANYESELAESDSIPGYVLPVPYFTSEKSTFTDSITTEIKLLPLPGLQIRYTTDGSEPGLSSPVYEKALTFKTTTTLKAKTFRYNRPFNANDDDTPGKVQYSYTTNDSRAVSTTFQKIDKNISIKLNTAYANQYAAGGENALIDGMKGTGDFRVGTWQGYEAVDASGEISFENGRQLEKITISCFQDIKSWIFMPEEIRLSYSTDGSRFKKLKRKKFKISESKEGSITDSLTFDFPADLSVKTIRFKIKNRGTCPKGHLGAGEKSWIFIDEIEMK